MPRPQRLSTRFARFCLALTGALVLALPLAACGRKGALDPPPGGYVLDQRAVRTPVTPRAGAQAKEKQPEYDAAGRPIAPEGPNKKLPADWLID